MRVPRALLRCRCSCSSGVLFGAHKRASKSASVHQILHWFEVGDLAALCVRGPCHSLCRRCCSSTVRCNRALARCCSCHYRTNAMSNRRARESARCGANRSTFVRGQQRSSTPKRVAPRGRTTHRYYRWPRPCSTAAGVSGSHALH